MAINTIPESGAGNPTDKTAIDSNTAGNATSKTSISSNTAGNATSKTTVSDASAGNPSSKTSINSQTADIPASKTSVSSQTAVNPVSKTTVSDSSAGNPSSKSTLSQQTAVIPSQKTALVPSNATRPLVPLVDLNFSSQTYNQKGSPREFDSLFTYSRGSAASFVNRRVSGGKAEYFLDNNYSGSVTNLLTYSEQFDNVGWAKEVVGSATVPSVTANAKISPDGTRNADRVVFGIDADADGNRSMLRQAVTTSASGTVSVWLKSNTGSDQSIGLAIGGATSTSVIVTNEWVRHEASLVTAGLGAWGLELRGGVYGSALTADILVWGAQVVEGLKALPYVKTEAASTSETFDDSLRIEWDAVTGECLGALIEGSSTNLILRSEEFDNASWIKSSATIIANDQISPDGTLSADKVTVSTTSGGIRQTIALTVSTECAFSFFVKNDNSMESYILFYDVTSTSDIGRLNIKWSGSKPSTLSTVGDVRNVKYEYIAEGFYRVSMVSTSHGTNTSHQIYFYPDSSSGTGSVYLWGAQVEELASPSSYIRTEGATVTRAADVLSIPSAGNYDRLAGTISTRSDMTNQSANQMIFSVDDGTTSERAEIFINSASKVSTFIRSSGATVADISGADSVSFGSEVSALLTFDIGVSLYQQGALIGSDSDVNMPTCDIINIGRKYDSTSLLFGHIKSLEIYNEVLTGQEIGLQSEAIDQDELSAIQDATITDISVFSQLLSCEGQSWVAFELNPSNLGEYLNSVQLTAGSNCDVAVWERVGGSDSEVFRINGLTAPNTNNYGTVNGSATNIYFLIRNGNINAQPVQIFIPD